MTRISLPAPVAVLAFGTLASAQQNGALYGRDYRQQRSER